MVIARRDPYRATARRKDGQIAIEEPSQAEVDAVREPVETMLATPRVEELVAAYFDPRGPFAGDTFRTLQPNGLNRIGEVDLLAVQLLVNVRPRAVREVLDCADDVGPLLKRIPADVALWDAIDQDLVRGEEVFDRLDECHGVGEVIAGKLLARKRAAIVPIIDTAVRKVLCLPDGRSWTSLRAVLQDGTLRRRIKALQPRAVPEQPTIRLLDVAAWMRCSNGGPARAVRSRLRIPDC